MKELDIIKAQFLGDDIDPEDRLDNEAKIKEWEQGLIENKAFLSWQNHDITKEFAGKLKKEYKEISMLLAFDRKLSDAHRASLWAKQDACVFILEFTEKDAKGQLEQIHEQIHQAINAT